MFPLFRHRRVESVMGATFCLVGLLPTRTGDSRDRVEREAGSTTLNDENRFLFFRN